MTTPRYLPSDRCALVGMVHLLPTPGSPGWSRSMTALLERARRDAGRLVEGGCDALIVENMADLPYLKGAVRPETVAAMTLAVDRVADLGVPVGLQVLAAANRQALGVAAAAPVAFLRVEAFAYGHLADEGWMDACAGELMRARAELGLDVAIWADVQKKHAAHAATADLSLADLCHGAVFCGADVLIVTGRATGDPTALADVVEARSAGVPVAVGSGVTPESAGALASTAQALIVGSALKVGGRWREEVEPDRVRAIKAAMTRAR